MPSWNHLAVEIPDMSGNILAFLGVIFQLVVEPTPLKYMLVKMGIFPKDPG